MSKVITDSNQMLVKSNVLAPPTELLYIYPVKDMFVTQTYPVFSFGEYAELYVRKSSTDECKTIMSFDIPELNKKVWEHILYSKIRISFRTLNRSTRLVLRRVIDDGWSELGLTWAGQPTELPEPLAIYDVNENTKYIELDFHNYLVEAEGEPFNFSFSITEECEDEQYSDINIYSKESVIRDLKPQIITEYEFFPDNYDIADLSLMVAVKTYSKKDLSATVKVRSGNSEEDLPATISINNYDDKADLNASIYTAAISAKDLSGSVIVQRDAYRNLPGKLQIPLYSNNKDINAEEFKVHVPKHEMTASLTLTRKDKEVDLAAPEFGVKKDAEAQLEATLSINLYNPNADLESYIAVKAYGNAEFNGNIKVNGYEEDKEIPVDLVVKANETADIEASLIVPYHKLRADLPANFAVSKTIPIITPKPDDGDGYHTSDPKTDENYQEILDMLEKSSLPGSITVRSHDGEANLNASVTVISRKDLPVDFAVKSYYRNADLEANGLFVLPYVGFEGILSVSLVSDAYIDVSTFRVRPSWAKDMTAKVKVVKDSRKPYAFIM